MWVNLQRNFHPILAAGGSMEPVKVNLPLVRQEHRALSITFTSVVFSPFLSIAIVPDFCRQGCGTVCNLAAAALERQIH